MRHCADRAYFGQDIRQRLVDLERHEIRLQALAYPEQKHNHACTHHRCQGICRWDIACKGGGDLNQGMTVRLHANIRFI